MKDIVDHPDLIDQADAWIDVALASMPARAAAAMTPAIAHIAAFGELAPGWDTYDADAISPVAIRAAINALVELAKSATLLPCDRLVPYHIAPLADGGVQLEWEGSSKGLEIEFGTHGDIRYLLVTRTGAGREYEQGNDLALAKVPGLVSEVLGSQAN